MRKEILIAIVAGIAFGLTIAFGVWRANSALQNTGKSLNSQNADGDQNAEAVNSDQLKLVLAKPEEKDVVTQNPVTLEGITKPGSWVVVSDDQDDIMVKTESDGTFSASFELVGGINSLVVTAVDDNGNTISQNLNLVYSTEIAEDNED